MHRPFSPRMRRSFRHLVLTVAIVAGAVLALAGAALALVVLAVGALAHAVWSGLRQVQRAAPGPAAGNRVIDGEYAVVGRSPLRGGEPH